MSFYFYSMFLIDSEMTNKNELAELVDETPKIK